MSDHPHNLLMIAVTDRYRGRFEAVHGDSYGKSVSSLIDDYKLFGDIIEPLVLNAWNSQAVQIYAGVYINRLNDRVKDDNPDEVDAEVAFEVLMPVLAGFFEHSFLLGVMFEQERLRND